MIECDDKFTFATPTDKFKNFLCGHDCDSTPECPCKPAAPSKPVYPKFEKDRTYEAPTISKLKPDSAPLGKVSEGTTFDALASRIAENSDSVRIPLPPAKLKGLVGI